MIQHMRLVFQADNLSVSEGAFLMACCQHADARGYVSEPLQLLADEAHMLLPAAQDTEQQLIQRGLLLSAVRTDPANGQLSDLRRVDLSLLADIQRTYIDYGPTDAESFAPGVSW
ncbi:hypothetical protein [Streptomyces rishiriensis]|uniref:Uncharacterized protein n=1 Tax=Streptomyces rishiriensis TaxID=68264 RepID=A0ABU0NH42_STRRH|nr:hypothetical protein [Streptomyces rishiriensis]MDQ0577900.1 hypothetical protein [Streptomyces rishiriensis]